MGMNIRCSGVYDLIYRCFSLLVYFYLTNHRVEIYQFRNEVNANGGAWIRLFDPEISNSLWFSPEPGPASAHIL